MNTTFKFNGEELEYLIHPYNRTSINERKIEIPIVMNYIKKYKPNYILEIGNVLHHYYPDLFKNHNITTVDKYEKDVTNKCLLSMDAENIPKQFSNNQFGLIISISTLEHVGVDDYPKWKHKKTIVTKDIIDKSLSYNGILIATIPLNYKQEINDQVEKNEFNFTHRYYMERYNLVDNLWKESNFKSASNMVYRPNVCASGLVIGIHDKNLN